MQMVCFDREIPPNKGSVARLCDETLTPLHLIEPLGFKIDDKHLKRAGLDYWEFVDLRVHGSWEDFLSAMRPEHLRFFSKRAIKSYPPARYRQEAFLVSVPETRGSPYS